MSTNMNVDRAEMHKAAGQVEARSAEINGIQRTLDSEVNMLMAGWTGNAANAFYQAYAQVAERFTEVHAQLDRIHERLVDTQRDYTVREDESAQATNAIAALLNN